MRAINTYIHAQITYYKFIDEKNKYQMVLELKYSMASYKTQD